MEEDNDVDNTVGEDGTSRLIQETFNNVEMDDDDNQYDGYAFDKLVVEREIEPLYKYLFSLLHFRWST